MSFLIVYSYMYYEMNNIVIRLPDTQIRNTRQNVSRDVFSGCGEEFELQTQFRSKEILMDT